MKKEIFFILLILLFVSSGAAAQDWETAETNGFFFSWAVEGENLMVKVSTETTGWIAVGFDPTKTMKDANIIIGYVDDEGELFIQDHYGNTRFSHKPDTEMGGVDNLFDTGGWEKEGITHISFTIPLDSGDPMDRVLVPGKEHKVIFASYTKDKITIKHNKRSFLMLTL